MKQKFLPFDIVRNLEGDIGFITDSGFNECQTDPLHQYKYSIQHLNKNPNNNKCAWYNDNELIWLGTNFLELLAKNIAHPFCHDNIGLNFDEQRRK
jgi:hypothetical protein